MLTLTTISEHNDYDLSETHKGIIWNIFVLPLTVAVGNISQVCYVNPLNAMLNPICPLLALFGAHHILHVSR